MGFVVMAFCFHVSCIFSLLWFYTTSWWWTTGMSFWMYMPDIICYYFGYSNLFYHVSIWRNGWLTERWWLYLVYVPKSRWSKLYFIAWWLTSSVMWVTLFIALILEVGTVNCLFICLFYSVITPVFYLTVLKLPYIYIFTFLIKLSHFLSSESRTSSTSGTETMDAQIVIRWGQTLRLLSSWCSGRTRNTSGFRTGFIFGLYFGFVFLGLPSTGFSFGFYSIIQLFLPWHLWHCRWAMLWLCSVFWSCH